MRIELWKGRAFWHWRMKADNNEIVATDAGQKFRDRHDAERAATECVRNVHPEVVVTFTGISKHVGEKLVYEIKWENRSVGNS